MKSLDPYLHREEQARREVGHTTIRPCLAWTLTIAFLLAIYAPALIQQLHEVKGHFSGARASAWPQCYRIVGQVPATFATLLQSPGSPLARVLAANRQLLREMHAYEDALEDDSIVGRKVRPLVQYALAYWLGSGNEKAYCGVVGWLFYRADVDYLTGPGFLNPSELKRRSAGGSEWRSAPQPDPRPAILDFHRQLASRGIQLIVLPIPPKTAIQPEKFSPRFKAGSPTLQNPSYAAFIRDLQDAGVLVADMTSALLEAARSGDAYLATDTHWRPEAMELTARHLKQFIDQHVQLPAQPPAGYGTLSPVNVTNRGDIAAMLQLPRTLPGYGPETVFLKQILIASKDYWLADDTTDVLVLGDSFWNVYYFWQADEAADVLLLGDSFCNVYSHEAMGWGKSAGLIEQLSRELQRPLDRLVINDNSAYATRALLARELARGRDRLAGKRLVIWQFAMRELSSGDWPKTALTLLRPSSYAGQALGRAERPGFTVPESGQVWRRHGVVKQIAPVPRPGTVPYKDHIIAAHLVELNDPTDAGRNEQALVYFESMRDNVWTAAARLRPGDTITVDLAPWSDVAPRYEQINRTELPDEELQLIEPCWGELLQ